MPIFEFKRDKAFQDRLGLNNQEKWELTLTTNKTEVFGVMLFPNNPEWRQELDAIALTESLANASAEGLANYPNTTLLMTPEFFETIQRVKHEDVLNRIRREMGRGKLAGQVLRTIKRICHNSNYEGSVNKATELLEKLYNIYGAEDKYIPAKRTNMLRAWTDFKTVAHLWAAAWHYDMMNSILFEDFEVIEEFGCSVCSTV